MVLVKRKNDYRMTWFSILHNNFQNNVTFSCSLKPQLTKKIYHGVKFDSAFKLLKELCIKMYRNYNIDIRSIEYKSILHTLRLKI